MKGYKGFEKGLVCRGKQYAENAVFEEDKAAICSSGMHFCELPHQVFEHYSPGENHEFAEVEALDEAFTDDNRKYCTKKLKVGTKVSVFDICKISVNAFFKKFDFNNKINKARESKENNAGYRGAANVDCYGAANAGDYGAANAGDCGAANVGDYGAANAGRYGAANAGHYGAANAGDYGAANAGRYGAANAGRYGAAIVREDGSASVGKSGVAVAFNGQARGRLGAVIVLIESDDDRNAINAKSYIVDGEKVKADTYYRLKSGRRVEVK